jgi:hypothetical protein
MKKKIELRQKNKKPSGVHQSERSREISLSPLTKLIMDVPNFPVGFIPSNKYFLMDTSVFLIWEVSPVFFSWIGSAEMNIPPVNANDHG